MLLSSCSCGRLKLILAKGVIEVEIDLIVKLCLIGVLFLFAILIWLFCESELKKIRSMLDEAKTKIGEEKPEEAEEIIANAKRRMEEFHRGKW